MITVKDLTRRYQDLIAVNQVSFQIQKGEVVGLLGHNGAGKTTVMKMLSGFLSPSAGTIELDGQTLPEATFVLQSSLGYLPEVLPVYPEMSVIDYLDFIACMRNISKDLIPQRVAYVIDATDLRNKAKAPIHTLSRGYKQRVGVAQAILHNPKILILDEPTNGLDPEQTQHMRDLIIRLSKEATVILSTHIMQEVEAICSRVLIMQNGHLSIDASLNSLQRTQEITLKAGANQEKITQLLGSVPDISDIFLEQSAPNYGLFTLKVATKTSLEQALSQTARRLINEGVEIFSIAPKHQNLGQLVSKPQAGDKYAS